MEKFIIRNSKDDVIGEAQSFKNFVRDNRSDLRSANLRFADLGGVDISNGNAEKADLSKSNLRFADRRSAEFECANLQGADLSGANLQGADLSGANLQGANLQGVNVKNCTVSMYNKHSISIQLRNPNIEKQDVGKIKIIIGCKTKTIAGWDKWFASDEEFETPRNSFEFKQIHGMYEAYKSYIMTVWGR